MDLEKGGELEDFGCGDVRMCRFRNLRMMCAELKFGI
jgi:hypothetical protein